VTDGVTLYSQGALVGGPSSDDGYIDSRPDYVRNEVALDYNAGGYGDVLSFVRVDTALQMTMLWSRIHLADHQHGCACSWSEVIFSPPPLMQRRCQMCMHAWVSGDIPHKHSWDP
jgi:hypothetical protein